MNSVIRLATATACAWWLAAGTAPAQCPGGICPVTPWSAPGGSPAAPPASQVVSVGPAIAAAVCRVVNASEGGSSVGTGALIQTASGGPLVLTCDHLFREGAGRVTVTFRTGGARAATVVERDSAHDLALLRVADAPAQPLRVRTDAPTGYATACGLGGDGRLRAVRGRVVGRRTPAGAQYPSVLVAGAVRSGDSGGPLLSDAGEVVGVVWGVAGEVTYATAGAPLARLLERAPSRREPKGPSAPPAREDIASRCPCNGRCVTAEELHARLERFAAQQSALVQRVEQLERPADAPAPPPPAPSDQSAAIASLLEFAVAGVGVGGPIGVALLLARFAWRRRARRRRGSGGPRGPTFP